MPKTLATKKLKEQWDFVCNEWAKKFSHKQQLDFDGWIGDEIGGVGCFGDYFFNLSDIITDITEKHPKGLILKWQEDGLEAYFEKKDVKINYKSYALGLRYEI